MGIAALRGQISGTFTTAIALIRFASRNFSAAAALVLIFYFLFVRRHKWYSVRVPVIGRQYIELVLGF